MTNQKANKKVAPEVVKENPGIPVEDAKAKAPTPEELAADAARIARELEELKDDMDAKWEIYDDAWLNVEIKREEMTVAKTNVDTSVKYANDVYKEYTTAKKAYVKAGGVIVPEPVAEEPKAGK